MTIQKDLNDVDPRTLATIPSFLPHHLPFLTVSQNFAAAAPHFANLKKDFTPSSVAMLVSFLNTVTKESQLTSIDLSQLGPNLNDTHLAELATKCTKLKSLNLNGCTAVTKPAIYGVLQAIHNDVKPRAEDRFSSLSLRGCTQLTAPDIKYMLALYHIPQIDLSNSALHSSGLASIFLEGNKVTPITSLTLDSTQINLAGVRNILNNGDNREITFLSVNQCPNIGENQAKIICAEKSNSFTLFFNDTERSGTMGQKKCRFWN